MTAITATLSQKTARATYSQTKKTEWCDAIDAKMLNNRSDTAETLRIASAERYSLDSWVLAWMQSIDSCKLQ